MNNHRPMSNPTPLLYNYSSTAAASAAYPNFDTDRVAEPIVANSNAFWSIAANSNPTTQVSSEFDSVAISWPAPGLGGAGAGGGGNESAPNDVRFFWFKADFFVLRHKR